MKRIFIINKCCQHNFIPSDSRQVNKKVQGNKEAYRKVDYQIPVQAAQYADANQFLSRARTDYEGGDVNAALSSLEKVKSGGQYAEPGISTAADWTPLKGQNNHFQGWAKADLDLEDPWQFKTFLVTNDGN